MKSKVPQFGLRFLILLLSACAFLTWRYRVLMIALKVQGDAVEHVVAEFPNVSVRSEPITPRALASSLSWFLDRNKVRRVVELNGERCGLNDYALRLIGDLPYLERLYLASNPRVSDQGLSHLSDLKKLQRVSIWKTGVTDDGLSVFAGMPDLTVFDMSVPGTDWSKTKTLTSDCLVHFRGLKKLRVLKFSFAADERGVAALATLPLFHPVELSVVDVSDVGLNTVSSFKSLEKLRIRNGSFEGTKSLGNLPLLRELKFSGSKIRSQQLTSLPAFPKLKGLAVDCPNVDDGIEEVIARQPVLTNLDLRGTTVTAKTYPMLRNHSRLVSVEVPAPRIDSRSERIGEVILSRTVTNAPRYEVSENTLAELASLPLPSLVLFLHDRTDGNTILEKVLRAARVGILVVHGGNVTLDCISNASELSRIQTLRVYSGMSLTDEILQHDLDQVESIEFSVGVRFTCSQGPRLVEITRGFGGPARPGNPHLLWRKPLTIDVGLLERFPNLEEVKVQSFFQGKFEGDMDRLEELQKK